MDLAEGSRLLAELGEQVRLREAAKVRAVTLLTRLVGSDVCERIEGLSLMPPRWRRVLNRAPPEHGADPEPHDPPPLPF